MFTLNTVDETETAELRVHLVEGQQLTNAQLQRKAAEVEFDAELDTDQGQQSWTWHFEEFRNARAAYGLWKSCGPFALPESDRTIPIEVATEGKAAISTYLFTQTRSRRLVADELDISPSAVSNYLSQIRWQLSDRSD